MDDYIRKTVKALNAELSPMVLIKGLNQEAIDAVFGACVNEIKERRELNRLQDHPLKPHCMECGVREAGFNGLRLDGETNPLPPSSFIHKYDCKVSFAWADQNRYNPRTSVRNTADHLLNRINHIVIKPEILPGVSWPTYPSSDNEQL